MKNDELDPMLKNAINDLKKFPRVTRRLQLVAGRISLNRQQFFGRQYPGKRTCVITGVSTRYSPCFSERSAFPCLKL